jgi:exodeoxyribonuclease VII large subunit
VASRQVPFPEPNLPDDGATCSVSELCGEVRDLLRAYPRRWVEGEVQRVRRSRAGHLYFELVEKGDGDEVVAKLDAVSWRRDATAILRQLAEMGQELSEGMEIRCHGDIDFYPPFGRLQLVVREVDSVFVLGRLSRRRQEIREGLVRDGLFDRNRQLTLPPVPLDVALVTSEGSAAYHDFLSSLGASGFGFRVLFVHAAVQGATAEKEISSALETAGSAAGIDCSVLVRGGGSKVDLAAFDSRRVAEAVARSPVPVVTGLGHEIDLSIADQVAHAHTRTPTQAAEFLIRRVGAAEESIDSAARRLAREGEIRLRTNRNEIQRLRSALQLAALTVQAAGHRVERVESALGKAATGRLVAERRRLGEIGQRIELAVPRLIGRRSGDARAALARVRAAAGARLRLVGREIDARARLLLQMSPEKLLARGFSITRDARGSIVRSNRQVTVGETITTQLFDGVVTSRVEE